MKNNPPLIIDSIDKMIFFIESLKETDPYIVDIFLNGGCYRFHLMLKKLAPKSELKISKDKKHVVTYFKGKHFDITGVVDGNFEYLNNLEMNMVTKWSFSKNMAIKIGECPVCEEPIII